VMQQIFCCGVIEFAWPVNFVLQNIITVVTL